MDSDDLFHDSTVHQPIAYKTQRGAYQCQQNCNFAAHTLWLSYTATLNGSYFRPKSPLMVIDGDWVVTSSRYLARYSVCNGPTKRIQLLIRLLCACQTVVYDAVSLFIVSSGITRKKNVCTRPNYTYVDNNLSGRRRHIHCYLRRMPLGW